MNILVVCQHYYPETFRINDICKELVNRGHKVTVLTGLPNYPAGKLFDGYKNCWKTVNEHDGVKIHYTKITLRGTNKIQLILNYFSFWKNGCRKVKKLIKKENFDCVFVYQLSPIFMAFPGIKAAKKQNIPLYTYVLDLWPESLAEMTGIKSGPIYKYIKKLTKKVYNVSDKILISSEAFKASVCDMGIAEDKVMFWPQYAEEFYNQTTVPQDDKARDEMPEGFNIIYTGNFGEAQGLETAVAAAQITAKEQPQINWIFMGGGRDEAAVISAAENAELIGKNVFFIERKPATEVSKYLSLSDAALLILKDMPLLNITLPAKLQSYFACSMPVIACCNGEGANIVKKSCAGLSCSAEDVKKLAETAIRLYNTRKEDIEKMRLNARTYFDTHYTKDVLMDKFEEVIK